MTEFPIVCIAPTGKGFVIGHKNAGLITHYEVTKSNEMIFRG
ncbi:MAG: hypothetical protein ACK52J_05025 [bacterium]|jgi:hypothetical protein